MKRDVGENFYLLLHPRPVTLIVTISREGRINIMTCSWNTPLSEEPPLIGISVWKGSFTHKLLKEVPEFTVNIPSSNLLKDVMIAGTKSGKDVDKLKEMNVTLKPAKKVKPPIIEECLGHMECKVVKEVDVGECTLFIGEVVEAYAEEEVFRNYWDLRRVNLLLHNSGRYFTIPKYIVKG